MNGIAKVAEYAADPTKILGDVGTSILEKGLSNKLKLPEIEAPQPTTPMQPAELVQPNVQPQAPVNPQQPQPTNSGADASPITKPAAPLQPSPQV